MEAARSITDVPTINAVNTFETDISSIVGKFHHIHFLFNGDATKNNYNFIGNATFNLTYFGSITHASTGIKSTTSGYFKTGYVPSIHSTLTSSHISAYNRTNNIVPNSETKLLMGCFQDATLIASTNLGPIWSSSPSWVFNTNGVWQDNTLFTTLPLPWTNTNRFLIGSRTSSTDIIGGIDKTYLSRTTAVGRNNSPNIEVFGLCSNYVGTPSFYSDKEISFISQGTGLTTSEMLLLNNAVDTLMTTLGINV